MKQHRYRVGSLHSKKYKCCTFHRVSKKQEEGFAGDKCVGLFYIGCKLFALDVWRFGFYGKIVVRTSSSGMKRFWLEDSGFGGTMEFWCCLEGYLIRLTFVEFGLLAVETLEMGLLVKYLNCSWLSWVWEDNWRALYFESYYWKLFVTNVWRDNVSNEIQLFYYYSPFGINEEN